MMKKITMQAIADEVGVSKYAVSRALSGQSGVSEKTRETIIEMAIKMGYFLQRQSRSAGREGIASRRYDTYTIVILLPSVRQQSQSSTFWGRIIDGISDAVRDRGFGVVIVTVDSPDHFFRIVNPKSILGLVCVGLIPNFLLLEIKKSGIHFVLVDHEDEMVPSDTIFANNTEAARKLTNFLIAQGHHVVQFIGSMDYSTSFYDRWMGFKFAIGKITDMTINDPEINEFIMDRAMDLNDQIHCIDVIIRRMVQTHTLPTAFVCANDTMAIHTISVLKKNSIRVPQDVSVTGFDDIDEASQVCPALTTVHLHKEYMGRRAVDLLFRRIENPNAPLERWIIRGDVCLRDSTSNISERYSTSIGT